MNETLRAQQGALVFCALSVPAVMLLPSLHPAAVVAATALAALLWRLSGKHVCGRRGVGTALMDVGMLLLSAALLGAAVGLTGMAYPDAGCGHLLGLGLLALAVYAVRGGIEPLLRTAAICFFFNLLLGAVIAVFGLKDISVVYPADAVGDGENYWALAWLLLPLAAAWTDTPARPTRAWRWGWALLSVLPCLVCWLNLSGKVAASEPFPFYTLAKSVRVLGVMERFEVLLSAALTTGIFCLMGIFARIFGNILQRWLPRLREGVCSVLAFAVGAAASLLPQLWRMITIAVLAVALLGVAVPAAELFSGKTGAKKFFEK